MNKRLSSRRTIVFAALSGVLIAGGLVTIFALPGGEWFGRTIAVLGLVMLIIALFITPLSRERK